MLRRIRLHRAMRKRAERLRAEAARRHELAGKAAWADYVEHGGVDRLLHAWSFSHPAESTKLAAVTEVIRSLPEVNDGQ